MAARPIDTAKFLMPWEHYVCSACLRDNPHAVWLIKQHCLKPGQHHKESKTLVVIGESSVVLEEIRQLPQVYRNLRGRFIKCPKYQRGQCSQRQCGFAHTDAEQLTWNMKKIILETNPHMIVEAGRSQNLTQCRSPSVVCRACFEDHQGAVWLASLLCVHPEEHQSKERIKVVVAESKLHVVRVSEPPVQHIPLQDSYCRQCFRTHSREELQYWDLQRLNRSLSQGSAEFQALCDRYQFPTEEVAKQRVEQMTLTQENYKAKYHLLVYLDEMEHSRKMIQECNGKVTIHVADKNNPIIVEGMSSASIDYAMQGHAAVEFLAPCGRKFSAIAKRGDSKTCSLYADVEPNFFQYYCRMVLENIAAHFEINHIYFRQQQQATAQIQKDAVEKLLPSMQIMASPLPQRAARGDTRLPLDNEYQQAALEKVLATRSEVPNLVLGPFGTGKTRLVAAAVLKLLKDPNNKILVCTHQNKAADHVYSQLQETEKRTHNWVVRLVPRIRNKYAEPEIYPGGNVKIRNDVKLPYLLTIRAIVTTFLTALSLKKIEKYGNGKLHFTHILIDEGAQSRESEALGALVMAERDTKVIIVGDNKQVGPQVAVLSKAAKQNGFGTSLIERLFAHYKSHRVDKKFVSTLLTNYRSHPSILMLASTLLYECRLLSRSDSKAHPLAPYPIIFSCSSLEQDLRRFSNRHAVNVQEAELVVKKALEFIESWPAPQSQSDELPYVGIMATTREQVTHLRRIFERKIPYPENLPCDVAILPTYIVQGDEFSAVFLSTCEATDEDGNPRDPVRSICNEQVFNTLVTRARSLIFAAGNPFLLQHMGKDYSVNCWEEYIRRCIRCQTLQLPEIKSEVEEQTLPATMDQLHQLACSPETLGQATEAIDLQDDEVDEILHRYTSDLLKKKEFKLAHRLVQDPKGRMAWEPDTKRKDTKNTVWCRLDMRAHHSAVAVPTNSSSDQAPIKLDSQAARRLAFHGDIVPIDRIRKCVLLDSKTEKAVNETHFGASFLCRVDPRNPIMFFPLDKRHPKFVNLPTLSRKDSKERMGVVCFDPKSVGSKTIPMMNDFIPLEHATKMLFIVRFLGWREQYRFPLGIIVAALPAGYSVNTGDQIQRIANSIPLTPALISEPFHPTPLVKDGRPHYSRAITIDPQGSRDHDDALTCVRTTKNGDLETFEFGVHITSLHDYISKDSELDRLARERGCSVYQSPDRCISHMLPTALTEATSLLPGETRAAFSVVGEVRIRSGNIQRLQLNRITESHVKSALELTYSDAQALLNGNQSISQDLQAKVRKFDGSEGLGIRASLAILWKIAFHLRKVRLGEAAHCFFMDDPDCEHHPEAHFLVEQFMIWANEKIAERLLQSRRPSILRAQGPPDKERLQSLVENQGPNMALSLALRKYKAVQDKPSDSILILQNILVQLHRALRNGNTKEALHIIQFEHLHPQTAVPHHLFKRVQSPSNYCVSGEDISYRHDTLQCEHYTHFTSPIRRYIDLVIHRILYAALKDEPPPYKEEELKEICYECQKANRQARDYEREMKSVILASELVQSGKKYAIFVTKVGEGKLHLCFRDVALKWYQNSIPLRCLNAKAASRTPSSQKEEASPQSTLYEWNVKMTSIRGNTKSFLASDCLQFCKTLDESQTARVHVSIFVPEGEDKDLKESKVVARVKPVTCGISSKAWAEAQTCLKKGMSDEKARQMLQKMQPNVCSSNRVDTPVCQSPFWLCKLQVPVQPCEVMQVQLSAEHRDSMLKPAIQLLEVGPGVQVCIQHNMNPAECFTDKLTTNASQMWYEDTEDYFFKWEKVVLAEAAFNSLSDSQFFIIKDVILKWPKLQKCTISLDGQIYYQLPQPQGSKDGVELTLPESFIKTSYDFFDFMEGDLVCVRYNIATTGGQTQNTVFHMVVHHADKVKEKQEDINIFLKFVSDSSNYISHSMEKFLRNSTKHRCELQLIPLSLPYRRVYHSLHQMKIEKCSDLAVEIALGDAESKRYSGGISKHLQQNQVTMATSLWPLKKKRNGKRMTLNAYQQKAIDFACSNEFCMIQGPPGTGKSVTGAHMAYALAMKLRKELASRPRRANPREVPCVMYVGPSQHSVNVVLDMLITQMPEEVRRKLKILRVFSKGIERKEFPGPLENKEAFYHVQTDVDCKLNHKAVALHHLIRERNPSIKAMEDVFHRLHREGKIANSILRHEYNTAIKETELEVLKEDVDIVLCTCNEASSHRITRSVIPVYCIVDECAMATEPECMVPIRRAEHVVLIGDHQQLQPVINYKPAIEKGLGRSLFERYVDCLREEPHMLRVQYRMHRAICEFPSKEFYNGLLQTDERVRMERERQAAELRRFWPQGKLKPFVFCNVIGEEDEVSSGWKGTTKVGRESKFNGKEARKIVQIMKFLRDRCKFDIRKVTALTPYSAQKDEIKKEMERKNISRAQVKTITESQGSEFDIVLLSTVRSKKRQEILTKNGEKKLADFGWRRANLGFITDRHQICVAITRCKYGLVIVGNKALLDYDPTWSNLIDHYRRHNCITEEGEFPVY